jgi:hypothetical protein
MSVLWNHTTLLFINRVEAENGSTSWVVKQQFSTTHNTTFLSVALRATVAGIITYTYVNDKPLGTMTQYALSPQGEWRTGTNETRSPRNFAFVAEIISTAVTYFIILSLFFGTDMRVFVCAKALAKL